VPHPQPSTEALFFCGCAAATYTAKAAGVLVIVAHYFGTLSGPDCTQICTLQAELSLLLSVLLRHLIRFHLQNTKWQHQAWGPSESGALCGFSALIQETFSGSMTRRQMVVHKLYDYL
jgi:hypothetical protein